MNFSCSSMSVSGHDDGKCCPLAASVVVPLSSNLVSEKAFEGIRMLNMMSKELNSPDACVSLDRL